MEVCHIKAITPLLYNQQDAQLKKNNISLKHILTSIQFLVSHNIALRGKNTTYGNFRELIALICNDIPELKAWFNTENRKSLLEAKNRSINSVRRMELMLLFRTFYQVFNVTIPQLSISIGVSSSIGVPS